MRSAHSLARLVADERGASNVSNSARAPNAARSLRGTAGNSSRKGHILVVDDDETIRHMVTGYLLEQDLSAIAVSDRKEFHQHFARTNPNVVLLDVRLGRDDGLDLLKEIRAHSDVPIILMTGHHLDEIDRIIGLELGADDYIAKPFSLRELLARLRATLRRQEMGRLARDHSPERGTYRFGGWRLELRRRRLIDPSGELVPLSKGEYALLLAFLNAPQRPLTREHLLQATRMHEDIFDRSIDVQVLRLRRKLDADPGVPSMIRTERGVGYVFTLPVEPG